MLGWALLALGAWAIGAVNRSVRWRGHRLRIRRLSRFLPAPVDAISSEPLRKAACALADFRNRW